MSKFKIKSEKLKITAGIWMLALCLFTGNVDARVLINEIYPNPEGDDNKSDNKEWVELYNTEDQSISLVGWYLVDAKGNKKFLDSLVEIEGTAGNPFMVYVVEGLQGWLNNVSNEEEKVELYNSSNERVDAYTFYHANEDGTVWGRYPDGGEVWDRLKEATQGTKNSEGFPKPTPEPSNTPTPEFATPTLSPIPTSESTPTLSVSKVTVTPRVSSKIAENKKRISIGEPGEELIGDLNVEGLRKQVLASNDSITVEGEASISAAPKGKIDPLALGLIAGGGSLLILASLPLVKKFKRR